MCASGNDNFYKSAYSAQVHGAEFPAGGDKIIAGEVKQLLPSQEVTETMSSFETPEGMGHSEHIQNVWGIRNQLPGPVKDCCTHKTTEVCRGRAEAAHASEHSESGADLGILCLNPNRSAPNHPQLLRRAGRLGIMLKLKTNQNQKKKKGQTNQHPG